MEKRFLYSTGKRNFKKPNCEYYTDGSEFDELHRFTKSEIHEIDNLKVRQVATIFDAFFPADEIKIKRVK